MFVFYYWPLSGICTLIIPIRSYPTPFCRKEPFKFKQELLGRIELPTSSLPRKCSTTELQQLGTHYFLLRTSTLYVNQRAGDEIRTRDLQLGRLSLYQMSYSCILLFKEHYYQFNRLRICNLHAGIGGQRRVRTFVLVREQIYSLSPLTTRPSTLCKK